LARALGRGLEAGGHRVELIDAYQETEKKLSIYEFLAVGAEPLSAFSGKLADAVPKYLAAAGYLSGKRSLAFMVKQPLFAARALARLMKAMEHEGMFLKYSELLESPAQAEEIGKRLRL
jgi:hypothetical protein